MDVNRGKLWLHYWEKRNEEVYDYKTETKIIESELKKESVRSILSLGCGTGPYLRRLALKGFKGTGVDKNQTLIDIGINLAQKKRYPIRFICADIRKLPNLGLFDAAFAMHLTFPIRDWIKVLKSLKPLLIPGGIFVSGFIYLESNQKIEKKGVSADLLSFQSDKNLIEIDHYLVKEDHYRCSMILMEESGSEILCDRQIANIYFFPDKSSIISLLNSNGFKKPKELLEEKIGFQGLKAILVKTVLM